MCIENVVGVLSFVLNYLKKCGPICSQNINERWQAMVHKERDKQMTNKNKYVQQVIKCGSSNDDGCQWSYGQYGNMMCIARIAILLSSFICILFLSCLAFIGRIASLCAFQFLIFSCVHSLRRLMLILYILSYSSIRMTEIKLMHLFVWQNFWWFFSFSLLFHIFHNRNNRSGCWWHNFTLAHFFSIFIGHIFTFFVNKIFRCKWKFFITIRTQIIFRHYVNPINLLSFELTLTWTTPEPLLHRCRLLFHHSLLDFN